MIGDIAGHKSVMDAEKLNVSTANKSTWTISMTMATEPKVIVQIARQSLNLEWVDVESLPISPTIAFFLFKRFS